MTIGSEQHHYTLSRQLFLIGASLGVSLLIYIIYKIVIKPLLRIQFYRKQGISCDYFPLIGRFRFNIQAKKKYGDTQYPPKTKARTNPERVTCSNFFSDALLSINDPVLIKEFFLNNDNYIKDPMFFEMYKIFLGDGILTAEGNKWKTQRKILSNSFNFEFLKSLLPSIQQEANQNLLNIKKKSLTGVNIMEEFQRITGGVVGRMFFGDQINKFESNGQPLTIALADLLVDLGMLSISPDRYLLGPNFIKRGILPKHKKLMNKVNSFKQVCWNIIQERKKLQKDTSTTSQRKDMLDYLLENSVDGKMTDEEITDQFVTFFLAGMDTTGHLLTMIIYYLEQYPEYKEKMIQEIKTHYSPEKTPDMDEINKLEFTMAFIKETLRYATPVPAVFLRKAIKDHTLKDLAVRKGDIVSLNFFYNSFNPEYFKEVEKFDPMRWLGKEKLGDAYAFIPFSAGPRNCIGQHLSLLEARIILAEFLNMYDYKMKEGYELKMSVKFLYEPVEDILLTLTPKSQ